MMNLNCTTSYLRSANGILRAIEAEFGTGAMQRNKSIGALVMGGKKLTGQALDDLAEYAFAIDQEIIYVEIDHTLADNQNGFEITYFAMDGCCDVETYEAGHLWRASKRSKPRIIFPDGTEISTNADGTMKIRDSKSAYHDHGYELADLCLQKRIKNIDSGTPVTSWIDDTPVIYDIENLPRAFVPEDESLKATCSRLIALGLPKPR